MAYGTFSINMCYKESLDFGGYLTFICATTPITLWWLLAGLAFYTKDFYVQLLSSSYWVTAVASFVLQELIKQNHPHPDCNPGWGSPAFEVQLAYHFMVLMLSHRLYWIGAVGLMDTFRGFMLVVLVPLVLILSGNYTFEQVAIGAVVGLFTGAASVQFIFLFWLDRIEVIAKHPALVKWGFTCGLSMFYTNKTQHNTDMPHKPVSLDPFMSELPSDKLSSRIKYPIRRPRLITEAVVQTLPPEAPIYSHLLNNGAKLVETAIFGGKSFDF